MKTFFFLGVKTYACGMRKESCWIKLAGALSTVRKNVALTIRTPTNKQVPNTYNLYRRLHGRTGIHILSLSAVSISHSFALLTHEKCFQHVKIKVVSPRVHVMFCLFNRR